MINSNELDLPCDGFPKASLCPTQCPSLQKPGKNKCLG
jgi:hypothetical protein